MPEVREIGEEARAELEKLVRSKIFPEPAGGVVPYMIFGTDEVVRRATDFLMQCHQADIIDLPGEIFEQKHDVVEHRFEKGPLTAKMAKALGQQGWSFAGLIPGHRGESTAVFVRYAP